jgi:hypothetical protein
LNYILEINSHNTEKRIEALEDLKNGMEVKLKINK